MYKWKVMDSPAVEGSSAVRVDESFEYSDFESFRKNLENLQNKVGLLSFMVEEIQTAFRCQK